MVDAVEKGDGGGGLAGAWRECDGRSYGVGVGLGYLGYGDITRRAGANRHGGGFEEGRPLSRGGLVRMVSATTRRAGAGFNRHGGVLGQGTPSRDGESPSCSAL